MFRNRSQLAMAIALAGCLVGPNAASPPPDSNSDFKTTSKPSGAANTKRNAEKRKRKKNRN